MKGFRVVLGGKVFFDLLAFIVLPCSMRGIGGIFWLSEKAQVIFVSHRLESMMHDFNVHCVALVAVV